jgi:hypothetical protein
MKLLSGIGIAAGLLVAGCGGSSDKSSSATNAPAAATSAAEAPAGYLGALTRAQQTAVKTVDTVSLNQAIERFNVDNGRYPKDLDELVQEKYIHEIPPTPHGTKLVYDAAAGKVTVAKQ